MFDWLKRKPKEETKLTPEFEAAVTSHMKKYMEEYVEQIQALNIGDVIALPNFLDSKKFGSKELPLAVCVKEAYLKNSTVLACVNDIAKAVASAPPALQLENGEGAYEAIFTHPVLNLLNNPNSTQTRTEFIEMIMMHLLLCGNSLVWKNIDKSKSKKKPKTKRDTGPVFELIVIDPDMVDYKDNGYEITSYSGKKGTKWSGRTWDPDEIIHFRLTNPMNAFWGISPIQAAYRAIDIDSKIIDWWLNSLENGCKKDAILKFAHDLTTSQFQRMRNLIDQQLAGFRSGRGWMILGHEVDIEFLDMTPAELDFTQSRETSAKEIMRIFAVPPPILGDMDQSTYNNMEEATKAFWVFTVVNHLNKICDVFTKRLLPDYDLDINVYYLGYNTLAVEPLRKLYYEAIDNCLKLVGGGVPLNDAAKIMNLQLKDYEGGDVGRISHNLVPLTFYDNATPKDSTTQ